MAWHGDARGAAWPALTDDQEGTAKRVRRPSSKPNAPGRDPSHYVPRTFDDLGMGPPKRPRRPGDTYGDGRHSLRVLLRVLAFNHEDARFTFVQLVAKQGKFPVLCGSGASFRTAPCSSSIWVGASGRSPASADGPSGSDSQRRDVGPPLVPAGDVRDALVPPCIPIVLVQPAVVTGLAGPSSC